MEPWVLQAIIPAYAGLVTLVSLTGTFGQTSTRRQAARDVLRLLLPWGVIALMLEQRSTLPRT